MSWITKIDMQICASFALLKDKMLSASGAAAPGPC